VSPLSGLTELLTLYIDGNPLSEEQINELRAALPECSINETW